jgi:hypothetical protein
VRALMTSRVPISGFVSTSCVSFGDLEFLGGDLAGIWRLRSRAVSSVAKASAWAAWFEIRWS